MNSLLQVVMPAIFKRASKGEMRSGFPLEDCGNDEKIDSVNGQTAPYGQPDSNLKSVYRFVLTHLQPACEWGNR